MKKSGKKKSASAKKPVLKRPGITLYTTPSCPYCHVTKEFLKKHKFPYKEIDVSKNNAAAREMIQKSGQVGVPVIDIKGQIIIGFDQPALERILKGKKK